MNVLERNAAGLVTMFEDGDGTQQRVKSYFKDGSVNEYAPLKGDPAFVEPVEEPTFAKNVVQGLTTNDPPRGAGGFIGRAAPATVGALIGSPTIAGAGIGAAAGESLRQAAVSYVHPESRPDGVADTVRSVVQPVSIEGALGATGEAGGRLISKGAKAAWETVAPKLATIGTKVPLKYTAAAVKGDLAGAKTLKEAGDIYEKSLAPLGVQGLDVSLKKATGKRLNITSGDFMLIAEKAAKEMEDGTITPQTALWGRQAIQKIEQASKLGRDEYAGVARQMGDTKKALDGYLDTQIAAANAEVDPFMKYFEQTPTYKEAREEYFRAKGAEAFNSWFPRNKDKSPDVLRSFLAVGSGSLLSPFISPRVTKGAIDATRVIAPQVGRALRASGPAVGELTRPTLVK